MQFTDVAIENSKLSTHPTFKHGALLIRGNYILEEGHNNHAHHAEVNVITKYLYRVLQGRHKKVEV